MEIFGGRSPKGPQHQGQKVRPYGRGGSYKPKAPHTPTARLVDTLLVSPVVQQNDSVTTMTSSASSIKSNTSCSLHSKASKSTIKVALKQVLGGGGNDHGEWKSDGFHTHYGRGGGVSMKVHSDEDYDRESLHSVSTNELFFVGDRIPDRPTSSESDRQEVLHVGPGEGIFHPYGRPQNGDVIIGPSLPATLSRPSMAKSGQSKLSVKSAVKEVLGGGGNDHDEWKFQNTFHPGFGRGGEGARRLTSDDPSIGHSQLATGSMVSFSESSTFTYTTQNSSGTIRQARLADSPYDFSTNDGGTSRADPTRRRSISPPGQSRVRYRERAFSDGTPTTSLADFRQQLEARRRLRNLGPGTLMAENPDLDEDVGVHATLRHFRQTGILNDSLRHPQNEDFLSNGYQTFDPLLIPPPPKSPAPLPPAPSPLVTPLLLPSLPLTPSPSARRGSFGLPPAYTTGPRKTNLPTMPAPPNGDELLTAAYPPTWRLSSPGKLHPSPPRLILPNSNHSPVRFSPARSDSSPRVSPRSTSPSTYSPADALTYGLALAQAQRDVIVLERQVYAAEREAFEAQKAVTAHERIALERERAAVELERLRLEEERRLLEARVEGLRKEAKRREKTIEGLTWLVGNLENGRGVRVVSDGADFDGWSPTSDGDESEATTDVHEREVEVGVAR